MSLKMNKLYDYVITNFLPKSGFKRIDPKDFDFV